MANESSHIVKNTLQSHFRSGPGGSAHWLQSVDLEIHRESRTMILSFPHSYFADWFEMNVRDAFEDFVRRNYSEIRSIQYRVSKSSNAPCPFSPFSGNEKRFSAFLHNSKNESSFLCASNFVRSEGMIANPLIVCGQKGTGKTHLLSAIANACLDNARFRNILLTDLRELDSVFKRTKNPADIRNAIYTFDALFLDDIHLLDRYRYLQNELLFIFDYFNESGRQMVFACRETPSRLETLQGKLQSRLDSGLLIALYRPDLDIRLQCLQQESARLGLNLSEEQILFLAQWLPDFRSIHSALSRLALSGEFQGGTFRTKQLQELVQADEETPEKPPDCEFILEKTAAYFRLEPGDLKSSRRSSSVVLARQCAMYLCRCLSNSSYDAIGQAFGGKNHATVIYAFKKIQQLQKDKKKVKNMLEELSTICRNR